MFKNQHDVLEIFWIIVLVLVALRLVGVEIDINN